jgi:hypothetical protein
VLIGGVEKYSPSLVIPARPNVSCLVLEFRFDVIWLTVPNCG